MQNKIIAIPINDQPGQPVALAPNQAAESRVQAATRSIFDRLRDSALEEIEIEILFPAREPARHDLGFRIIDRAPDQVIPPVLERNDVAVVRPAEDLQDFAPKDPIVPVQNARARFHHQSGHGLHSPPEAQGVQVPLTVDSGGYSSGPEEASFRWRMRDRPPGHRFLLENTASSSKSTRLT